MRGSLLARVAGALSVLAAAGCSIHPDVLDVTDLPVFDVVQRIECEAADALRATYLDRGLQTKKPQLVQLENEIGRLQDELKRHREGLEFETGEELADAIYTIDIQILQLQAKIAKLLTGEGSGNDNADNHYAHALMVEGERLLKQKQSLTLQKQKFEAALSVDKRLKARIGERTRYAEVSWFEGHLMVFQFLFQITEKNNATISNSSIIWPIALGTFTLGFDVGDRKTRMAVRNVKLALKFEELLYKLECGKLKTPRGELTAIKYPIVGTIGLGDVINDYLRAAAAGKFKAGGESYTDRIQFTTKVNGSLKPQVDIGRKVGQVVKVQGELGAEREDIHELTVFLSPAERGGQGGSEPIEVVVKKLPDLRARSLDVQPPQ